MSGWIAENEGEREVVMSTGEIVVLPEWVAAFREKTLARRAEDRLAFCRENELDPDTFRGCHACGGTGWAWANDLPCFCDQGKSSLRFIAAREKADTDRLRGIVNEQRRMK